MVKEDGPRVKGKVEGQGQRYGRPPRTGRKKTSKSKSLLGIITSYSTRQFGIEVFRSVGQIAGGLF